MSNTNNVLAAFPEQCDDNDTLPNPVAVLNAALTGPSTVRDNYDFPTKIDVP